MMGITVSSVKQHWHRLHIRGLKHRVQSVAVCLHYGLITLEEICRDVPKFDISSYAAKPEDRYAHRVHRDTSLPARPSGSPLGTIIERGHGIIEE